MEQLDVLTATSTSEWERMEAIASDGGVCWSVPDQVARRIASRIGLSTVRG